jgi:hypothetical protein
MAISSHIVSGQIWSLIFRSGRSDSIEIGANEHPSSYRRPERQERAILHHPVLYPHQDSEELKQVEVD